MKAETNEIEVVDLCSDEKSPKKSNIKKEGNDEKMCTMKRKKKEKRKFVVKMEPIVKVEMHWKMFCRIILILICYCMHLHWILAKKQCQRERQTNQLMLQLFREQRKLF